MTDIVDRLNGMGSEREAALMAKLEAAENEVAHIKEVEFPRKVRAVAVGWETKCARLEQERTIDEQRIADLMAELNRVGQENEELHARIEAIERQEPPRGWWDDLIADISTIDCMYRGSPTYAHDAYWMRDRVVWMLKQRRDSAPGTKGE